MIKLIDITDEDAVKVVNSIHFLTENTIVERTGILGLSFEDSYRKYGEAHIEFLLLSRDTITDGQWTTETKFKIIFKHNYVWFAEFCSDGEASNYNKNHFCGYLKLQELGYVIPTTPQI